MDNTFLSPSIIPFTPPLSLTLIHTSPPFGELTLQGRHAGGENEAVKAIRYHCPPTSPCILQHTLPIILPMRENPWCINRNGRKEEAGSPSRVLYTYFLRFSQLLFMPPSLPDLGQGGNYAISFYALSPLSFLSLLTVFKKRIFHDEENGVCDTAVERKEVSVREGFTTWLGKARLEMWCDVVCL